MRTIFLILWMLFCLGAAFCPNDAGKIIALIAVSSVGGIFGLVLLGPESEFHSPKEPAEFPPGKFNYYQRDKAPSTEDSDTAS